MAPMRRKKTHNHLRQAEETPLNPALKTLCSAFLHIAVSHDTVVSGFVIQHEAGSPD